MIPHKIKAYNLLHQGAIALAQVEANGIRMDVKYLKTAIKKTEKKILDLTKELKEGKVGKLWKKVYGHKMNFQSTDQLGVILFDKLGLECTAYTATGKPKTDETALMAVSHPFVKKYLKIKKLSKANTTYLKGLLRETIDGYLHPFFNLNTALTFRSSSDSPNFQNIPVRIEEIRKLVRQAFIARKGNHLVEIDYGGIEVRVAACYHKDPRMISYIKNPKKDMHRDMAIECYKLRKDQVTKEIRFYGKNCFVFPQFYGSVYTDCASHLWEAIDTADLKTAQGIPLKRHLAKKGIRKLGDCDIKEKPEVGTFEYHLRQVERKFWNERFPVYAEWKKHWYRRYLKRGWFVTKTGFTCKGFFKRNEAINYPVQGSAFHCLLWSLIRLVTRELKKHKMKSLIVGQIHDSILCDVPDEELDEFLVLANDVMTKQLVKEWKWIKVPLEVEAEVCPLDGTWADKKEMEIPK